MGGDPPATIQSLHESSFKSYKDWHLQPLSVHRAEYRFVHDLGITEAPVIHFQAERDF